MSPDGVEFQHVSPKLATLRLGNALALCGALCGAISALVLIVDIPALWWLMLVPAAIALFCLWLVPAQVRALRYALADTDFVIRRGVFSRSLTLVPYGRIQYVDIGPRAAPAWHLDDQAVDRERADGCDAERCARRGRSPSA